MAVAMITLLTIFLVSKNCFISELLPVKSKLRRIRNTSYY